MLCLAPLWLMLLALWTAIGSGDAVTRHFIALRDAWPETTRALHILTDWSLRGLYALWAGLFVYSLCTGKKRGMRRVLIFALVQIGVTMLAVQAAKWAIGRPRPLFALEGAGFLPWSTENRSHSFPSGHSAEATGACSGLAIWKNSTAVSLFLGLIIAFVGFSRIYLSKHHLTDVAAGSLVGLLASLLLSHLCNRETP